MLINERKISDYIPKIPTQMTLENLSLLKHVWVEYLFCPQSSLGGVLVLSSIKFGWSTCFVLNQVWVEYLFCPQSSLGGVPVLSSIKFGWSTCFVLNQVWVEYLFCPQSSLVEYLFCPQ